jgi:hypothetical protein
MGPMNPTDRLGAPSWHISSDHVDAWVTVRGAQVAPVEFRADGRTAQPYSVAPWAPGSVPGIDPLLDSLRGDFLCLPFGPQPSGPQHGCTASSAWEVQAASPSSLTLHMDAVDIGASVTKTVSLREGHTAVYQEFVVVGLDGAFPYGTHPILDFSPEASGPGLLSTSPMRWMSTNVGLFSDPAAGEHQVLAQDATFDRLDAVPCADGTTLDVSAYPTAPGHEDLVMLVNDPAAGPIGWSAVSFAGFTWFSLKDVSTFPGTLLWISNGGRSQSPWLSRHTARMGIEDVCSYFADGLEASRRNLLAAKGIPTVREFSPDRPVRIATLQGVVFTPPGFGPVADINTEVPGRITVTDESGHSVEGLADWAFVLENGTPKA